MAVADRLVVAVLLAAGAMVLLSGCSPAQVGIVALSQRDGHLLVAVMRCDDTALERVAISHAGPLRTDGPRERVDDARWITDIDNQDVVVLDTADPGGDWEVKDALEDLDPRATYSVSAGGDTDHTMGSVGFTTAELDALDDGQWLIGGDRDSRVETERPTTTDLDALRSTFCDQ
ncbi:hypothetical protein [Aeromicrobium yanjiei]|uniref:Lipoprotein n=1 Tax=Aeromicrobium yanjiei TaxID=2662028 RepID=A0A5Q2MJJ7_9ACTN|nr:hypothetical protein [Aeromicrobium yanjiei]QGG41883.1 hypothetical protein GEV26_11170 [Aeromicrobium yanjiei]